MGKIQNKIYAKLLPKYEEMLAFMVEQSYQTYCECLLFQYGLLAQPMAFEDYAIRYKLNLQSMKGDKE